MFTSRIDWSSLVIFLNTALILFITVAMCIFLAPALVVLYLIEERQLMFFSKLQRIESIVLRTLYYVLYTVPIVKYEMRSVAVKYGLSDVRHGSCTMQYGHVLYRQFTCSVLL